MRPIENVIRAVSANAVAALFLLGTAAMLSACSSGNLSPLEDLATTSDQPSDEEYKIQSGDVVEVQVWGEPRLSGEVVIREDGKFTLPLVNDITAEGKSATEVRDIITEELTEYIPAASVTVSVKHSAPTRYFLSGQFMKPGEYRSDKKITFLQAVATGGGFAPFADDSSIILIRRGGGTEMRYELDYTRVVQGEEPNPVLRNGDIIAIK